MCSTKNISQWCSMCPPPFVKLSYSTIDNVLTNLLPAGLQEFFRMLQRW